MTTLEPSAYTSPTLHHVTYMHDELRKHPLYKVRRAQAEAHAITAIADFHAQTRRGTRADDLARDLTAGLSFVQKTLSIDSIAAAARVIGGYEGSPLREEDLRLSPQAEMYFADLPIAREGGQLPKDYLVMLCEDSLAAERAGVNPIVRAADFQIGWQLIRPLKESPLYGRIDGRVGEILAMGILNRATLPPPVYTPEFQRVERELARAAIAEHAGETAAKNAFYNFLAQGVGNALDGIRAELEAGASAEARFYLPPRKDFDEFKESLGSRLRERAGGIVQLYELPYEDPDRRRGVVVDGADQGIVRRVLVEMLGTDHDVTVDGLRPSRLALRRRVPETLRHSTRHRA